MKPLEFRHRVRPLGELIPQRKRAPNLDLWGVLDGPVDPPTLKTTEIRLMLKAVCKEENDAGCAFSG